MFNAPVIVRAAEDAVSTPRTAGRAERRRTRYGSDTATTRPTSAATKLLTLSSSLWAGARDFELEHARERLIGVAGPHRSPRARRGRALRSRRASSHSSVTNVTTMDTTSECVTEPPFVWGPGAPE